MNFIEIERSTKKEKWSMSELHAHSNYELYFLLSGERQFFVENVMYKISAPCFIALAPFTVHKTEGDNFTRVNVNASPDFFGEEEKNILTGICGKFIDLNCETGKKILSLLADAETIYSDKRNASAVLKNFLGCIIYYIDEVKDSASAPSVTAKSENVSPLALKLIDKLNYDFIESPTLNDLSAEFFISKAALCRTFKRAMNCTVNDYVLQLKLNKAKRLLVSTNKHMEEIAAECGFSSAAYMGIIFKRKIGLSPREYKKLQISKQN